MSEEKANMLIAEIEKFAKEKRYEFLPVDELPKEWSLSEYIIYREICYNNLCILNFQK